VLPCSSIADVAEEESIFAKEKFQFAPTKATCRKKEEDGMIEHFKAFFPRADIALSKSAIVDLVGNGLMRCSIHQAKRGER
jgi:hypothetical protein